jgi:hypothetical protein
VKIGKDQGGRTTYTQAGSTEKKTKKGVEDDQWRASPQEKKRCREGNQANGNG